MPKIPTQAQSLGVTLNRFQVSNVIEVLERIQGASLEIPVKLFITAFYHTLLLIVFYDL